ncbi:hypothetical protein GDO81_000529 [Engystomops pustulosus]|uniref:WAP domain-containing protein n=1 Tax=Engystomops pustulosus TaxID=76066 RepID=A0AAV7D508_ENGPU|nr:hypothetical protein GDO81_000529 [Engystomops pustulosus]
MYFSLFFNNFQSFTLLRTPMQLKGARRGECPKPLASMNTSCVNNCTQDNECPKNKKCCDTGNGQKCVYAVRPGFCPSSDLPHDAGASQKPICPSDFDCPINTKCCPRGSTQDCLPLLKEKPGRCPDVCDPKSEQQCSGDVDCPGDLKCCPGCGQKCMVPIKVMHAFPSN